MNKKFINLKVIAIVSVVLSHIGGIVILDWFQRFSFRIPLFLFISGYFYKQPRHESNIFGYIKNRINKLIIPYFGWNLVYGILTTLLISRGVIEFGSVLSFKSFLLKLGLGVISIYLTYPHGLF